MALTSHLRLNGEAKDALIALPLISSDVGFLLTGQMGEAANFTGSESMVFDAEGTYLDDPSLTDALSVSCRFIARSVVQGYLLASGGQTGSAIGVAMDTYQGTLRVSLRSRTLSWSVSVSIAVGVEYAATMTWDGDRLTVYLNGQYAGEDVSPAVHTSPNNHRTLTIGRPNNVLNYFFDGVIEDVRCYNHCLSLREIRNIAYKLVLHYPFTQFQEPSSNSINDPLDPNLWYDRNKDPAFGFVSDRVFTSEELGGVLAYERTITGADYRANRQDIQWQAHTAAFDMTKYQTYSMMVRCLNPKSDTTINLNYQGANSAGSRVDVSKLVPITDEGWRQIFITARPSESGHVSILSYMKIYFNSPTGESTFQMALPMHEQKPYPTKFTAAPRSGTVMDLSRYDRDVALVEADTPSWKEESPVGVGSYWFNERKVVASNPITSGSFSFFGWINFDPNHPDVQRLMGGSSNYYAVIAEIPGTVVFTVHNHNDLRVYLGGSTIKWSGNADNYFIGNQFTWGRWAHVGMTYDAQTNTVTVYHNGRALWSAGHTLASGYSSTLQFGMRAGSFGAPFIGGLTDFRMYASAIPESEVPALYAARMSMDSQGSLAATGTLKEQVTWDEEIQAHNLVANGDGSAGDNRNFAGFGYVELGPKVSYFKVVSGSTTRRADQLIPMIGNDLDAWEQYRISCEIKGANEQSRYYFMIICYDRNFRRIAIQDVQMYSGTDTTLAQPVAPGDEWVYLTSAVNWTNSTGRDSTYHNLCYWLDDPEPYVTYKYTRRREVYNEADLTNNRVRFINGWPGPNLPAGTPVMNSRSGGTYSYIGASNSLTNLTNWVYREGVTSRGPNVGNVRFGTSYVKVGWLLNRSATSNAGSLVRNVRMWNVDSSQRVPFKFGNEMITKAGNGQAFTLSEVGIVRGLKFWYPLIGSTKDELTNQEAVSGLAVPTPKGYDFLSDTEKAYVEMPVNPFTPAMPNFTVSAWVYKRSSSDGVILSNHHHGATWESIWITTDRVLVNPSSDNTNRSTVLITTPIAQWFFITVTNDVVNDELTVYLDGQPVAPPNTARIPWDSSVKPSMGSNVAVVNATWDGRETLLDGLIRDLRIHEVVLSAEEVNQQYRLGSKALDSGMMMNEQGCRVKEAFSEIVQ